MKYLSFVVLVLLFQGCVKYVEVPRSIELGQSVDLNCTVPLFKTTEHTSVYGVVGSFSTSLQLMNGNTLIIFPKEIPKHFSLGQLLIMRKESYYAYSSCHDAIRKAYKKLMIEVKNNNKDVPR